MMAKKSRAGRYGPTILAMALGGAALAYGHLGRDVQAQAPKRDVVKSLRLYVFDLGNIPVAEGRMFDPANFSVMSPCSMVLKPYKYASATF